MKQHQLEILGEVDLSRFLVEGNVEMRDIDEDGAK